MYIYESNEKDLVLSIKKSQKKPNREKSPDGNRFT